MSLNKILQLIAFIHLILVNNMNRLYLYFAAISFAFAYTLLMSACNSSTSRNPHEKEVNPEFMELPLPLVPDNLTSPEERAAFVTLHFWDAMDFNNPRMLADTAMVEQAFANFVSVLEITQQNACKAAVNRLVERSSANGAAFSIIRTTADHYLGNPDSPLRNDSLYLIFLERYINSSLTDEAVAARYAYKRQRLKMNLPGTTAPDFRFNFMDFRDVAESLPNLDKVKGSPTRLHEILKLSQMNAVIFFDPDCEQCEATIRQLIPLADSGEIQLIAVVLNTVHDIEDLYDIPATPTIYLISPDATILAKDLPASRLL